MKDTTERRPSSAAREKSRLSKEEWREYTKTVWQIANVRDADHPAVFPLEIPRRLIKLFSFSGETVLDPFAGVGTTAMAAIELGRNAVCIEQSPTFAERIDKIAREAQPSQVRTACGDARDMGFLSDDSVDLIITSPPYWNKADYGAGESNLGNQARYDDFFKEICPVFRECARVLRPGRKLCVVTANVSQHTDCGLLCFPLAADFTWLLRGLGFVLVNEIIWSKDGTGGRWGSANGQRPIFGSYPFPPNFLFKTVHEYVLILTLPPIQPVRGPKVIPYKQLLDGFGAWRPSASESVRGAGQSSDGPEVRNHRAPTRDAGVRKEHGRKGK
jgi:site-specific DNA-methyltransferase (adenine-specific)